MERLYKKVNGKYVDAGIIDTPDLYDGVWFVHKDEHSKSTETLIWKLSDIPMVDISTFLSIHKFRDNLSTYLLRLSEENSKEYEALKNKLGGWIHGPIGVYNISYNDLTEAILLKLYLLIQNERETRKFTEREVENERSKKLRHIKKNVIIERIINKIKTGDINELQEKFNRMEVEILDELILNL